MTSNLVWPNCEIEERLAIASLLSAVPEDRHQILLDEIEGARLAGVIKSGMVPYTSGLVRAMLGGTFTIGHGAALASKRRSRGGRPVVGIVAQLPEISPEDLRRGQQLLDRIRTASMR